MQISNQIKKSLLKNSIQLRKRINFFLISLSFTVFLFFQCNLPKTELSEEEKKILLSQTKEFLNDWHDAASEANYQNYFDKMDRASIFIGTDARENWDKDAFADFSKPYFDKGKAWSFTAIDRNIYTNEHGTILWFDELLDTWMGLCRGSGVIDNTNGNFKIKHYVLSVTVPNEKIEDIINIKREKDSLISRSFK